MTFDEDQELLKKLENTSIEEIGQGNYKAACVHLCSVLAVRRRMMLYISRIWMVQIIRGSRN